MGRIDGFVLHARLDTDQGRHNDAGHVVSYASLEAADCREDIFLNRSQRLPLKLRRIHVGIEVDADAGPVTLKHRVLVQVILMIGAKKAHLAHTLQQKAALFSRIISAHTENLVAIAT